MKIRTKCSFCGKRRMCEPLYDVHLCSACKNTPAVEGALKFLARKHRMEHPNGEFDNAGRWYPSDREWQECCHDIRNPSRAYPYSLLVHCRTAGHVAKLTGTSAAELRKTAKLIEKPKPPRREGGDNYYKLVALVDGKMLSIFDGETEYKIGETMKQRALAGHRGGYYCYDSSYAARNAEFPTDSALADAKKVLLRVRGEGNYVRYGSKIAFSRITPLERIEVVLQ